MVPDAVYHFCRGDFALTNAMYGGEKWKPVESCLVSIDKFTDKENLS